MGGLIFIGILVAIGLVAFIVSKIHDSMDAVKERERLYVREKQLEEELTNTKQELAHYNKTPINDLKNQIQALQIDLWKKESQILTLKNKPQNKPPKLDYENLQSQIDLLKLQIAQKDDKIKEFTEKIHPQLLSKLEQAVKNKETELRFLEETLIEKKKEAEHLEAFLKDARAATKHISSVFSTQYQISNYYDGVATGRLHKALHSDIKLSQFHITSQTKSGNNTYITSLSSCTCTDFQTRKLPCKHMLYLAYTFGFLSKDADEYRWRIDNLSASLSRLAKEKKELEATIRRHQDSLHNIQDKESASKQAIQDCESTLDLLVREKCAAYPTLAFLIADLETYYYEKSAHYLETKYRPAITEALRIRDLRQDTREKLATLKLLEYQLAYIRELFPNIDDIFEKDFGIEESAIPEPANQTDRVRSYLSNEEYKTLSDTQRNQLALDRYVTDRKSKWQIGRDYEMYIGHTYEKAGFSVQYTGILKNLEDMGRDLIATSDNEVLIIQCKNWSKEKTIHEKHVFQLYGTLVMYQMDHPQKICKGIFVTTTELSPRAKKVADYLNISVINNSPLGEFPRIKCNINRQTGEKIYHLPFDQQYDHIVIERDKGEFYAQTVAEAESLGFRRAMKHHT